MTNTTVHGSCCHTIFIPTNCNFGFKIYIYTKRNLPFTQSALFIMYINKQKQQMIYKINSAFYYSISKHSMSYMQIMITDIFTRTDLNNV